jgi:aspartyl-tRNA(Asn)/glutamyl-tRNA(Gln) amidotransferase subunit A
LIAFASSLDQVGPLASDVRGAARTLSVIAGHCPNDSTSSELPVEDYEAACERGAEKLRVGVPAQYFEAGVDDEVREAVESVVDALRNAGCTIHPVELPHTGYGISTYYVIATAEASSNLSRFDGVRFGLRVEEQGASLADVYSKTRGTGFGPEVKRRIMLGTYALSSGYYDAYYRKAQQVRTLIRRDFDQAFNKVDLLVTPASPSAAFCLGERIDNPLQMYLADVFTLPASLAGICGITLPAGMTRRTPERPELPIGVQLLAKPFAEQTLFAAAAYWESQCPVSGRFATL